MARVKLTIPEKNLFETTIMVRITDINYGNHLGNDALVSLLHEARVQWLTSLTFTELSIEGVGLIMSDLAVEYKNEAFAGDELTITIYAGDSSKVGFELYYIVKNKQHKTVALAKTGMLCFNYDVSKVAPMPGVLKNIIAS